MSFQSQLSSPQAQSKILQTQVLLCKTVHTHEIETRVIVADNAHMGDIVASAIFVQNNNDEFPTGGFQSNGNFILSATTTNSEWQTPLNIAVSLSGNRTGQWCSVHLELENIADTILSGVVLFNTIPPAFQPNYRTIFNVSIWDKLSKTFAAAHIVYEPTLKQFIFFGKEPWLQTQHLIATLASAEQNMSQGAKRVAYIISVRNSTCSFICQSFCLSLLCASRDPLFLCKFLITSELRCFSISSRRALEFCDSHLTVMKIWEINAQRS